MHASTHGLRLRRSRGRLDTCLLLLFRRNWTVVGCCCCVYDVILCCCWAALRFSPDGTLPRGSLLGRLSSVSCAESRVRLRGWTSFLLRSRGRTRLTSHPQVKDDGWQARWRSLERRCDDGCCCPDTAKPCSSAAERVWRALAFGGVGVAAGMEAEAGPR